MVDELFDRTYQSARNDLNQALTSIFWGLGHTIGDSLKTLHRIEWHAPWASPKKPVRRA